MDVCISLLWLTTRCRTIVPIYQSEISPPNHVCFGLCGNDPTDADRSIHSAERSLAWSSPATFLATHPPWYVVSGLLCTVLSRGTLN